MTDDDLTKGILSSLRFGIQIMTALETVAKTKAPDPGQLEVTASLMELVSGNLSAAAEVMRELSKDG